MRTADLFEPPREERIAEGAMLLRGFAAAQAEELLRAVEEICRVAPFRHMQTPGGFRMSVAMTNSGSVGWVSDARGYRYDKVDPETGHPWPALPASFTQVASCAAARVGFDRFIPDAALINRYTPGTRLSLHQDRNERDFTQPIVSVSLGVPAVFLFGGLKRSERPRRYQLEHGDVVVWGGPSRLAFHGVAPLADAFHPLTGRCRINLTLRKAL
jgi:alkylated DNA repair protein (DNA oxidative demethylase)